MRPDKASQAKDALTALRAFGETQTNGPFTYDVSNPEHFEELASDLLANLMHAAEMAGVDWSEMVRRADMHYTAEVTEPYDLP